MYGHYVMCNLCGAVWEEDVEDTIDGLDDVYCPDIDCGCGSVELVFECNECGRIKGFYELDKDKSVDGHEQCYACTQKARSAEIERAFEDWEDDAFHRLRDDRLTGHAKEDLL